MFTRPAKRSRLTPREIKNRLPAARQWLEENPLPPKYVTRAEVWKVMDEVGAGVPELAKSLGRDAKVIRRIVARYLPADETVSIRECFLKDAREGMHLNHCPRSEWLVRYGSRGMATGRDVPLDEPLELSLK